MKTDEETDHEVRLEETDHEVRLEETDHEVRMEETGLEAKMESIVNGNASNVAFTVQKNSSKHYAV